MTYYAKHKNLSVAGGFETIAARDFYIWVSKSNNHPWEVCKEEEAKKAGCYQMHYTNDLLERYPAYSKRINGEDNIGYCRSGGFYGVCDKGRKCVYRGEHPKGSICTRYNDCGRTFGKCEDYKPIKD